MYHNIITGDSDFKDADEASKWLEELITKPNRPTLPKGWS